MSPKSIFVTGATGRVGTSVTLLLLEQGHTVHALVRTPSSDASQAIEKAGAKLFQGSFEETEAIAAAAQGCDAVFVNPIPSFADQDMDARHCANIVNTAKSVGVKSCVYISASGAGGEDNWPSWVMKGPMAGYWRGKSANLKTVRSAGFDKGYTILQPAMFMANFANDDQISKLYPAVKEKPVGRLGYPFKPESKIALIDPLDIAKFAAAALLDPTTFNGKEIPLSSERRTLDDIADAMTRASGKKIRAEYLDRSDRDTNRLVASAVWMDEVAQHIDFSQCKGYGIELTTLDQFLEREKETLKKSLEV